jgi:hypothetical protein
MNAESEYPDTYCYFYAEGFSCDPEEITTLLKITPTEFRRKGDAGRNGLPIKANSWTVEDASPRKDHFFEKHLESILTKIEPASEAILRLSDQCTIGVNCVGYFEGCNPGFEISPNLLRRLGALKLTLGFDLYAFPKSEDTS